MQPTTYSYVKTAWKSFFVALAALVPGTAAIVSLPEEASAFEAQWEFFAFVAFCTIVKALSNVWKTRDVEGNPLHKFSRSLPSGTRGAHLIPALAALLPLFLLLLAGCVTSVTTSFNEELYEAGEPVSKTSYKVRSKGDVEETLHEFAYKYGGEENVIGVGQSAVGVTSPAQSDWLRALLALPPEVLEALIPVPSPEVLD